MSSRERTEVRGVDAIDTLADRQSYRQTCRQTSERWLRGAGEGAAHQSFDLGGPFLPAL